MSCHNLYGASLPNLVMINFTVILSGTFSSISINLNCGIFVGLGAKIGAEKKLSDAL